MISIPLFEDYILKNLEKEFNIELELWDHGDWLELYKIIIPKELRGDGIGSQVMNIITDHADKTKKDIRLTPDARFGGSSVSRLKKFYQGFGFVKNRDYEFRNSSVRYHK